MAEIDSVSGEAAPCRAQTGQYPLSSANSVLHTEQARLAGVVATVCSSPVEGYSIKPTFARGKIDRKGWRTHQGQKGKSNEQRAEVPKPSPSREMGVSRYDRFQRC